MHDVGWGRRKQNKRMGFTRKKENSHLRDNRCVAVKPGNRAGRVRKTDKGMNF